MEIVTTGDGSKTLFNEQIGENYHSKHGAITESKHVFIQAGLKDKMDADTNQEEIQVLEIGFGTGLNFLMSSEFMSTNPRSLKYSTVEAFPLTFEQIKALDFESFVQPTLWDAFANVYADSINQRKWRQVVENVQLKVYADTVLNAEWEEDYDVIYFDAFAAVHQPEMWSKEVLSHVSKRLKQGGFFVTYAITGELKRTLKSLDFTIQKLPGAPGKREMLRAIKNITP